MRRFARSDPAPGPAGRRSSGGEVRLLRFAVALAVALGVPAPTLGRSARLDVRGRLVTVGTSPNLMSPGPYAGTFLLGDLDSGWITLRRSSDAQVIQNLYVGKSTLGLAASAGGKEIYAADVRG